MRKVNKNCGHNGQQCQCISQSFRIEGFIIPCLLLLLKKESAHGYKLREMLENLSFLDEIPAPGVIYRHLRCLEKDGMVDFELEPGSGGPARKVYSITQKGESFLENCETIIQEKKDSLNGFLKLLKE